MSHTKKHFYFFMSVSCFLLAFLLSMVFLRGQDEALASRLAPEVIRFHVLANSDSKEDQALKLEVKGFLLDSLKRALGENAGLEETREYIRGHLGEIEALAESCMRQKGYAYEARAQLTNCYFPTKVYGDLVFPSGTYEALRVSLGNGAGKNWWCVIYPALCFAEPEKASVPETSKEQLKAILPEEDYHSLENGRRLRWSRQRPQLKLWSAEALRSLLPDKHP